MSFLIPKAISVFIFGFRIYFDNNFFGRNGRFFKANRCRRACHFALWNPYEYCGFPVFANIEACYFDPLILLSALIGSRLTPEILPMLVEWAVVIHIWIGGIAAYHLFRKLGVGRAAAFAGCR